MKATGLSFRVSESAEAHKQQDQAKPLRRGRHDSLNIIIMCYIYNIHTKLSQACSKIALCMLGNVHSNIPVNHPESGRTVLIFTAVSWCPDINFTCPDFLVAIARASLSSRNAHAP